MSYLGFHFIFNLPLIVLLWLLAVGNPMSSQHLAATGIVMAIVVVFTTPWDNYAIAKGVWDFPENKILFRIAWCPIEEYAFFVIQSLEAILLFHVLQQSLPGSDVAVIPFHDPQFWIPAACIGVAWIVIGRCPAKRLGNGTRFHYGFHLLYWFLPVLALQWALAWPLFLANIAILAAATGLLGTYLCVADLVAIKHGIWFFDEKQITGHKLMGVLPWEEIAFFYLTSLIVVQSYLLFLPGPLRTL